MKGKMVWVVTPEGNPTYSRVFSTTLCQRAPTSKRSVGER